MAKQETTAEQSTRKARRHPKPEQVWIALAHCYRRMSSLIEQSFAESGLSLTDFMMLEAILHKGPMTITEIQASALLATGSMTAAVDRLESKGLIARTFSKSDRRARVLELTEEGRDVILPAFEKHSANLKLWMSALSVDERAQTFGNLRRLEKQMKAVETNAPQ